MLFAVFTISERVNARRQKDERKGLEEFRIDVERDVADGRIHARPGSILVAVRDYNNMQHLQSVLRKTNMRRHDIVVVTVRVVSTGAGEYELQDDQLFADYERELFTRVVAMAEKEGKAADLLVVPGVNPYEALVQTAAKLKASRLVTGVSASMDANELALRIGRAWEHLPEPRHAFSLEALSPGRPSVYVNLGPHPPRLWPEDVERLHELWLRLGDRLGCELHHRDVVSLALRRLESDIGGASADAVVEALARELHSGKERH